MATATSAVAPAALKDTTRRQWDDPDETRKGMFR